ncbi:MULTISPECIES: hypothetical protein [Sporolactobacillus]|uniref:Virus attachment protein p12 family protein n=1 Tax=Sporolactobacillus nakayamae TaxID=269670 RepID=A0A1I2MS81_9BACL|nr:hypothetical protein [Sporolactobacillus nakayamae]SFF93559.1 hypothetical protein SAMN02982927_00017 [Sporolactobacillus nakayamae]
MNLPTILILLLVSTLYVLAIRYVKRNKSACTDCGLSGACPVEGLRNQKLRQPCSVADVANQKPSVSELRMMIRK